MPSEDGKVQEVVIRDDGTRDVASAQMFCKSFHAMLRSAAHRGTQVVHSHAECIHPVHHFCGSRIAAPTGRVPSPPSLYIGSLQVESFIAGINGVSSPRSLSSCKPLTIKYLWPESMA